MTKAHREKAIENCKAKFPEGYEVSEEEILEETKKVKEDESKAAQLSG